MDGQLSDPEVLPDIQPELCDGGAIEDLEDSVTREEEQGIIAEEPEPAVVVVAEVITKAAKREIRDCDFLFLFSLTPKDSEVHLRSILDYEIACKHNDPMKVILKHSPEMTTSYLIAKRSK